MKLYAVEGNSQKLDGGAMFGNAPKALWQRWIVPDEINRIPMACRCLLMQTADGRNILFEAGIGNFFEPALKERYGVVESNPCLLDNLASLGVRHDDIDFVVLSHLHFDHAGGLLSGWQENRAPELLFPNAHYLVSAMQWQQSCHPHYRDRASFIPELNTLLEQSGRMVVVDDANAATVLPGIVFRFSHGHTPGLMLSEILTPSGPLVFCSDLIPGRFWVHLPICMGYDRFPELLIDEKKQLLEYLLPRHGRLFFTHDHQAVCASVMQDERQRFYAEPVSL